MAKKSTITSSSTAEYFSKNLQQVGFSSLTKSVLTTVKEAVDNSLDACEDAGILPEITIEIEKMGAGHVKNSDLIRIRVEDNGPGLSVEDLPKVFGEYLASSKFGRGRCSRGQQGIGISAATTWAQLTAGQGAKVISKTESMKKAVKAIIEVDIKNNKGNFKSKETIDWEKPTGLSVEFLIDGRIQLNGEGGLYNYLNGTALVNPHVKMKYKLGEQSWATIERVTNDLPEIPEPTEPHPHTMKLGEFIAHSHLFGRVKVGAWLKKGFSRVSDSTLAEFKKAGIKGSLIDKSVDTATDADFKQLFTVIQNAPLMAPSTRSVLSIGEEALSKSIGRLGNVDFFSVVTRKPAICDFKPVQVEVAIARLLTERKPRAAEAVVDTEAAPESKAGKKGKKAESEPKGKKGDKKAKGHKAEAAPTKEVEAKAAPAGTTLVAPGTENKSVEGDEPVTILRFANRVPLQFDKAACAIVHAIESVNWRAYEIQQPKGGVPMGPYVIAVSVVSPFIKFKNASKETVDGSEELVEEIRRALIQAGQRLSRHLRKEVRANDLEEKLRHIEQFGPMLVEGLCRITSSPEKRKTNALSGLQKILGRDAKSAEADLADAEAKHAQAEQRRKKRLGQDEEPSEATVSSSEETIPEDAAPPTSPTSPTKPGKIKKNAKAKTAAQKKSGKNGKRAQAHAAGSDAENQMDLFGEAPAYRSEEDNKPIGDPKGYNFNDEDPNDSGFEM